ncbi:MAG TPA: SCO family protein [Bacilli bacterium]
MNNFIAKNKSILLTAAIIILLAAGYSVYANYFQKEKLPVFQAVPGFEMNDIYGERVVFADVKKPKLVYFFYASCADACPISNHILKLVQEQLKEKHVFGKKVEMFSITIDPVRDTNKVLQEYAKQFGADKSGWKFLRTETPKEVRDVAKGFGVEVLNEGGDMLHSDVIFLLDADNHIRKYFLTDKNVDTIVKDTMSLL